VLIVDQSEDSREVLRTALELRGLRIFEAPRAREGLAIARLQLPNVIVLDLDASAGDEHFVCGQYAAHLNSHHSALVILGTLRCDDVPPQSHMVAKPYHYGPLIRTIEQLIQRSVADECQV
jgi:DNA-binding response OmpR family regulator